MLKQNYLVSDIDEYQMTFTTEIVLRIIQRAIYSLGTDLGWTMGV